MFMGNGLISDVGSTSFSIFLPPDLKLMFTSSHFGVGAGWM